MKPLAFTVALAASILPIAVAQTPSTTPSTPQQSNSTEHMHRAPATPSTKLAVLGLDGKILTFNVADIKDLPHLTVTVNNAHTKTPETYSGVPVSELIKRAEPTLANGEKPKTKPLMTIVVAGGTDDYHIVLTLCDIDPSCRNGMVIVADRLDGQPLTQDGAFKLIVTEDKKPQRWVRNLDSLTIKAVN